MWAGNSKQFDDPLLRHWMYIDLVLFLVALCALALASTAMIEMSEIGKHYATVAVGDSAGFTEIRLDLHSGRLEFEIVYALAANSTLSRVLLRGPRRAKDGTLLVDVDTGLAPIALTLCGGEVSCAAREQQSCLNKGQNEQCGRFGAKLIRLDTTTPDRLEVPNPTRAFHQLLDALKRGPQSFYYTIDSQDQPEAHSSLTLGTAYLL